MDKFALLAQIEALEQNLARVEQILGAKEIPEEFRDAVRFRFNRTLRKQTVPLSKLRERVQKGRIPPELAWSSFRMTRQESGPIFRECLEFLGGVVIRDKGLDKGICQVADELVRRYAQDTDVKWGRLTILGEEHFLDPVADIIRLRFPEWDVWNLPFTAHEFGHVVANEMAADEEKDFQDFLKEQGMDEQRKLYLNELFADAFATYILGPSYACASILLRFDPFAAYVDAEHHPSHAKRVYFIFEALEKMNSSLKGSGVLANGPYRDIIDGLKETWEDPLKEAAPSGGLSDEDKGLLNFWFSRIYDKSLDLEFGPTVMYAGWNAATMLSGELLKDKPVSAKLTGKEELRDVLNAAWHCRLYMAPDKAREIGDVAAQLCFMIVGGKPLLRPRPRRPV